jgi:hypothetical protein
MKENNKDTPNHTIKRPLKNDDPDKRHPNPDDPYEEKGMPNKEMPIKGNPHQEERMDQIPK